MTSFDVSLELSEEVLRHTPEGTYINVDDLRKAVEKSKEESRPLGSVRHSSFAAAKQQALADPELKAAFERQNHPQPPSRA